jgi:hypothetical protein
LRSSIAEALVVDAKEAVFASVADVRQTVGKVSNRAAVPWQPVTSMLSKIDELAARLSKLFERIGSPINVHRAKDRAQLRRVVAKSNCALVDSQGYVITSVKRDWRNAVTGSSIINAVRLYTHLRRLAAAMLNIELPSSRHCSLIMHQAPHSETEMLMELGTIGSFLEEPRLQNDLPAIGYLSEVNIGMAKACVGYMPPLYARLGVTAGHVA